MQRIAFGTGSGSALLRPGSTPGSPTVLFVHPANLQARCWRAVLAAVPAEWTCLAVDLSGHGCSGRRAEYDLAGWVRECVELLDAREVGGVHVVGASVGAAVAVELAAAYPDRVASVATVGGAFRPAEPAASREFLAAVAARGARNAVLDILASEPGLDEVLVAEVAADIGVDSDAEAARVWTAAAAAAGLDAAPGLRCPTLAIVGDRDLGCPVEDSRAFAELTGGRLAVIVEHGHLPMYTAPNRVAAYLASLIDGTREHRAHDRDPITGTGSRS
ncbi:MULTISPECIES: alpha/beta hydrolase [unclassified Embleya]|uniref:alpha/beta fold hydrolase n=4 Tax=Embleya TaxID=2699295 RepID=UPI0033D594B7